MSRKSKIDYLHSHSGLERTLNLPKKYVLVDKRFYGLFSGSFVPIQTVWHNQIKYYKVPIDVFFRKGGVCKNYNE